MATLTLDNIKKAYGDREVVHGVSCAVADGGHDGRGHDRPNPWNLPAQMASNWVLFKDGSVAICSESLSCMYSPLRPKVQPCGQ